MADIQNNGPITWADLKKMTPEEWEVWNTTGAEASKDYLRDVVLATETLLKSIKNRELSDDDTLLAVQAAINQGADVNLCSLDEERVGFGSRILANAPHSEPSLIVAVNYRKPKTALYLIENGVDINDKALCKAYAGFVSRDQIEVMRALIEKGMLIGPDDGALNLYRSTLLQTAAKYNQLEIARLLAAKNNSADYLTYRNEERTNAIQDLGAFVSDKANRVFDTESELRNFLSSNKQLLEENTAIFTEQQRLGINGYTALDIAASKGNSEMVRWLVEQPGVLDATPDVLETARYAARHELCDARANLEIFNALSPEKQQTKEALSKGFKEKRESIIAHLAKHQPEALALVEEAIAKRKDGVTLITASTPVIAQETPATPVIADLSANTPKKTYNREATNALMEAISGHSADAIMHDMLYVRKKEFNDDSLPLPGDYNDETVLEKVKQAIAAGAHPDGLDETKYGFIMANGWAYAPPLQLACLRGLPKVIDYLIEQGASVNGGQKDAEEKSCSAPPLAHALRNQGTVVKEKGRVQKDIVSRLIDKGANIYPSHIESMAETGKLDILELLIQKAPDPAALIAMQSGSASYWNLNSTGEQLRKFHFNALENTVLKEQKAAVELFLTKTPLAQQHPEALDKALEVAQIFIKEKQWEIEHNGEQVPQKPSPISGKTRAPKTREYDIEKCAASIKNLQEIMAIIEQAQKGEIAVGKPEQNTPPATQDTSLQTTTKQNNKRPISSNVPPIVPPNIPSSILPITTDSSDTSLPPTSKTTLPIPAPASGTTSQASVSTTPSSHNGEQKGNKTAAAILGTAGTAAGLALFANGVRPGNTPPEPSNEPADSNDKKQKESGNTFAKIAKCVLGATITLLGIGAIAYAARGGSAAKPDNVNVVNFILKGAGQSR